MQGLLLPECPVCDTANADSDEFCTSCGSPLVMRCEACAAVNVRSRLLCHYCGRPIWSGFQSTSPSPPDWPTLTESGSLDGTDGAQSDGFDSDPMPTDWPMLDTGQPLDLPPAAAPAATVATPMPAPTPTLPSSSRLTEAERQAAKSRKRASVRRAQLRQAAGNDVLTDVLLLEPDAQAQRELAELLEAFGFTVHRPAGATSAYELGRERRLASALIAVDHDGAAALDLCRRLAQLESTQRPRALLVLCGRDRHADRVRAQLAGADVTLLRPVQRGDLARALIDAGIVLPHDPRAGQTPPDAPPPAAPAD